MAEQLPEITQKITGDSSGLTKEIAKAEAAEESLGKTSKKTADSMTADEKRKGQAVSDFQRLLGDKLKDGETGLESLQREVTDTRTRVQGLRDDLAKTGNAHVFGDLKQAEADLKHLEGFLSDMEPRVKAKAREIGKAAGDEFVQGLPFGVGAAAKGAGALASKLFPNLIPDVADLGEKAGKALADGAASSLDSAAQDIPALFTPQGAVGAGVLAGIVTLLGPAIATALGAAVTAGVGLGVVGLAGFLDKNDFGLQNAAQRLKTDVLGVFTSGASVLLTPFEEAMQKLDGFFKSGASHITELFSAVAPAIAPIESMIESMVSAIGPALVADAHAFASIFSDPSFQSDVKGLGQNIAAFFQTIANNKDAVEIFFKVLFGLISEVLGILNVLMNVAGALAAPLAWLDKFVNTGNQVKVTWHDGTGALNGFLTVVQKAANSPDLSKLTQEINKQAATVDTLAGAMTDKLVNSVLDSQEAVLHFQESLTGLRSTLKQNHDQLKITTAAGQADREAVLAAVAANLKQYDSLIQIGVSAKDAAKAYDANTKSLETQLRKAGLTKAQIDGLIGSYRNVPDKVDTTVAIQGLTDAINNLDNLLRQLNGLPPLTTTTVHVKVVADQLPDYVHRGTSIAFAQGGVVHADAGLVSGVLPPRNPGTFFPSLGVLAGEPRTHGEIFAPLAGIPRSRAMGLGQTLGNAYGFDVVPKVPRSVAYGAGGGGTIVVHNHVILDGKEIHTNQITHAQRYKLRTGTTGLT